MPMAHTAWYDRRLSRHWPIRSAQKTRLSSDEQSGRMTLKFTMLLRLARRPNT
jgi:hypothetical protein